MSLIQAIKNLLKRILPPPVHAFNREVERILGAVEAEGRRSRREVAALAAQVQTQQQVLERMLAELAALQAAGGAALAALESGQQQVQELEEEHGQALVALAVQLDGVTGQGKKLEEATREGFRQMYGKQSDAETADQERIKALTAAVEKSRQQAAAATRSADEAVWAAIFNNTITHSTWLLDKTFSPGRWAVGYPYLYVMYRVLNEARPKRILELGLGQSTRMIAQYAAAFDDVEHIVVEHDQEWIDFFCNDFQLSSRSKIVRLDREMVPYREAEAVRVFKGFTEAFEGQKFDFISIDAPLGSDMKQYSRIDVLEILPQSLSKSFSVMLDDCNRKGELRTIDEIETKFLEFKVQYSKGKYSGKKDFYLLSSMDIKFLCSL